MSDSEALHIEEPNGDYPVKSIEDLKDLVIPEKIDYDKEPKPFYGTDATQIEVTEMPAITGAIVENPDVIEFKVPEGDTASTEIPVEVPGQNPNLDDLKNGEIVAGELKITKNDENTTEIAKDSAEKGEMNPEQIEQQNAEIIEALIDSGKFDKALIKGDGYVMIAENDYDKRPYNERRITILSPTCGITKIRNTNPVLFNQKYDLTPIFESKKTNITNDLKLTDNEGRFYITDVISHTDFQKADRGDLNKELIAAQEAHKNDKEPLPNKEELPTKEEMLNELLKVDNTDTKLSVLETYEEQEERLRRYQNGY